MNATATNEPRSRGWLAILACLMLAASVLAGCGSDDEPVGGDATDQPAQTQEDTTQVETTQADTTQVEPASNSGGVVAEGGTSSFDPSQIFRDTSKGVVTVRSVFGAGGGGTAAEGSGFVLSDEGEVVTNAHVVTQGQAANRTEASEVYVELTDRNVVAAEIVGADPFSDVALLKFDPKDLELTALELGDDADLSPGDPVAAIGSPFGQEQSLSIGIVSATERSVTSLTDFQIDDAIQTDAAINPGNSGGPLLDASGRVVGINQQIQTESGANDGVGFAVPVTAIKRSVGQLRENGEVSYAYIGVSTQDVYPQLNEKLDLGTNSGAIVQTVQDGSPAADADIQTGDESDAVIFQAGSYIPGDVITAVDDQEVLDASDLAGVILDKAPGDTVDVTVFRDGDERTVEVTLEERPDSLQAG